MKNQGNKNTTRICVGLFLVIAMLGTSVYLISRGPGGGGGGGGGRGFGGGGGGARMGGARAGGGSFGASRNVGTTRSSFAVTGGRRNIAPQTTRTPGHVVAPGGPGWNQRHVVAPGGPGWRGSSQAARLQSGNRPAGARAANARLAGTNRPSGRTNAANLHRNFNQIRNHNFTRANFDRFGWRSRFGWRWGWFVAGWPYIWLAGVPWAYGLPGDYVPDRYWHFTNTTSQDVVIYAGNQEIPVAPGQEVWVSRSISDWFSIYSDTTGESDEFRSGATNLAIIEDGDSGLLTVQPN